MDGTNGLTASDVALLGNNGGFGGNNGIFWMLALIILLGGGVNGGYGRGDYGQFATAASQQDILFSSKFSALDNKIDRVANGIADATFALNNSVKDGNTMVAGRVVDEGRAMQSQLADCCCTTQRNIDSVRFDMANYANAINKNIDDRFSAIEKQQLKSQLDAQAQEINRLYLAQQMCGVVRYPNSMAYDAGRSPFCNCNSGCYCNM